MTADLIYHQNVSVIFTWSIFDCEAIIRNRLYNNSAALLLCHCEEEISSRFYRSCSDSKYDLYYLLILATFSWLRKVFQRFRLIFSCGRQSLKFYKLPTVLLPRHSTLFPTWRHMTTQMLHTKERPFPRGNSRIMTVPLRKYACGDWLIHWAIFCCTLR